MAFGCDRAIIVLASEPCDSRAPKRSSEGSPSRPHPKSPEIAAPNRASGILQYWSHGKNPLSLNVLRVFQGRLAMVVRRRRAGPAADVSPKGNNETARGSRGYQSSAVRQGVWEPEDWHAHSLTVVSDLNPDEPVTEAELRLIKCLLGDSIAPILDPERQSDDEQ
jgi:hypothetical protein